MTDVFDQNNQNPNNNVAPNVSSDLLADKLKEMLAHRHLTTADSSEPKSVDYIKSKGVNIKGAMKGSGSVSAGIDFLLEYTIIVNAHLVEFMNEFNNYSWKLDKEKKPTNEPVDDFNHFVDSLRYACESKMKSSRPTVKIYKRR
jgi:phage terminase large subunit